MINIDNVEIIKKLGSGMFGTTYLVKYKNKQYTLKIQNILEKDKKPSFKNKLWRELDFYNFINKLNNDEQIFFAKLYAYKIYDNCNHVVERPFEISKDDTFFSKYDNSNVCVKLLLEYKEGTNLHQFLLNNKLTKNQVLSILLQICKIMLILYKAGYSHNDLHPDNIIINKTTKKYFILMNKKINYYGYQISAIDYGEVLHKKFGVKPTKGMFNDKLFLKDITTHMFNHMYHYIFNIISNQLKYVDDLKKSKKKLPWESENYNMSEPFKKIILNHHDFYESTKEKYLKMYPKARKLLKIIEDNIDNKNDFYDILGKKITLILPILNKIEHEFHLMYPKLYEKYWKWTSYYDYLLPKEDVLNLLLIDNYKDFVNNIISII